MKKLKYTFLNDILVKMLFVKFPKLLEKLVAVLLGIRLEDIEQFEITNPEMPPESFGDKFCRLDINMIVNGQRVDLEIQVNDEGDYSERTLYYWAREYSSALPAGGQYSLLPRTIIISIIDFIKFADYEGFHSEIGALEVTRHTRFSDKFCLHFFELPKVPQTKSKDDRLNLWLSLFKAKTEEELANLEALEVEEMEQAIQAYKDITVAPEFKEAERLRSKARHEEAQALYNAGKKRDIAIAKNMLADGEPIEKIVKYTGLTHSEIKKLQP